jgi:hypothetical protein
VFEVNTLPPASTSRLAPEQKQLLSHADGVGVGLATDISTQTGKSNTADNSLVGLAGTMTPGVVMVEATASHEVRIEQEKRRQQDSPCSQHLNKMLFSSTGLLALAKTTKDAVLLQQSSASSTLHLHHLGMGYVPSGRDDIKVEIFAQDNNPSAVLQHVSSIALHGLDGHRGLIVGEG